MLRASRVLARRVTRVPRAAAAAPLSALARQSTPLRQTTVGPAEQQWARGLSAGSSAESHADSISEEYSEARELLTDAEEALGTVYFEEDLQDATEAVKALLARFDEIKASLSDEEAHQLNIMVGLKMEELKSRLDVLMDNLIHDEED